MESACGTGCSAVAIERDSSSASIIWSRWRYPALGKISHGEGAEIYIKHPWEDTPMFRSNNCVAIHLKDIDLDNLLVTLDGKGRKQRIVPYSFELRRHLFRYVQEFEKKPHELLLSSHGGKMLGRCICLRDVKRLCVRLGFDPPRRTLHAFQHTFSVNYLRKGGSVFHLQKCLGHSSLLLSERKASTEPFFLRRTR